ncbi:MAG: hypothetical protein PHF92_08305 [Bacteroidales bacterium]|jgi:hypothetical protein|nr:hypothetical protein [Bacteroidales bacterium]
MTLSISLTKEQYQTVLQTLELAKANAYTQYLSARKKTKDRKAMNTAILEWAEYQDVVKVLKEVRQ